MEQKVAEINNYADPLTRKEAADIAIDWKLHTSRDGKTLVDTQSGRAKENLMGLSTGHQTPGHEDTATTFANEFSKNAPVPMWIIFTKRAWPKAVDKAVGHGARNAATVAFDEIRVCASEPKVVTSGG